MAKLEICCFQDKSLEILIPKIFTVGEGSITSLSKQTNKSEEFEEREIGMNFVLEALNLTRFVLPQSKILFRSELIELDKDMRD